MPTRSAEPPPLTVAVPTCNGARHLEETLRSILRQDGVDFDLIVCDDRSTDDTLAIVARLAGDRATVHVNDARRGLAGNWNACVARSRTEWVAIVHQDDVLRPGHFAAQMGASRSDGDLGMIAGAAGVIDQTGAPIESGVEPGGLGDLDRIFARGKLLPLLTTANPLRCSAVTIRAEAHQALGGFDPSYRYVVDWDFWLRLSRDWSVAWLATPTVDFRWHLESETHTFKSGFADLEETERLLANWPHAPAADKRLARAYLNRAYEASKAGRSKLAWSAVGRALRRDPAIGLTLLADPRLAARLALAPFGA